jgi:4-hydroxybenzoyl-CoA thioesterase
MVAPLTQPMLNRGYHLLFFTARTYAQILTPRRVPVLIVKRERHIEWGDCDPARIVFNPRYFEWFDACTAGLFSAIGLSKPSLFETHGLAGIPLVESRAQFLKPCSFGDTVVIETQVTEFGRSSFKVAHQLFNVGALAVEAFETRVWCGRDPSNPNALKAQPIPADIIARLSA